LKVHKVFKLFGLFTMKKQIYSKTCW